MKFLILRSINKQTLSKFDQVVIIFNSEKKMIQMTLKIIARKT